MTTQFSKICKTSFYFLLFGSIMGYFLASILAFISMPKLTDIYTTKEMLNLISSENLDFLFLSSNSVYMMIIFYTVFLTLWVKILFPKIKIQFKTTFLFTLFFITFSLLYIFLYSFIGATMTMHDGEINSIDLISNFMSTLLLLATLLFSSAKINEHINNTPINLKSVLTYTLIGSAFVLILQIYLSTILSTIFGTIFVLGGAGEITNLGWQKVTLSLIIFGGLSAGIFASLINWLIYPTPIKKMLLPIILVILTIISGESFRYYANYSLDMHLDTLNAAANLKVLDKKLSAVTVVTLDDNNSISSKWDISSTDIFGSTLSNQSVDLIPQNIKKLENYIDKNHYTIYTTSAMMALTEMKRLQWDIDGYRDICLDNIYSNGPILYSINLLVISKNLPVTTQNSIFLNKITDDDVFNIQGQTAYHYAESWISFGDIKKAKYFYSKIGKNEVNEVYDTFKTLINKHQFNSGIISGNIEGVPKNTKIALTTSKLEGTNSFYNIKSIQTIQKNGRFNFTNLVSGDYYLAILLTNPNTEDIKVIGGTRYLLSKENQIHENISIFIKL